MKFCSHCLKANKDNIIRCIFCSRKPDIHFFPWEFDYKVVLSLESINSWDRAYWVDNKGTLNYDSKLHYLEEPEYQDLIKLYIFRISRLQKLRK